MIIRDEAAGDATAIAALVTAAFRAAPHASGTEATIVDALREAGTLHLSLVGVEGDTLVGHVAFSRVTVDGRDAGWFGLGPVAVHPERQGRGIGSALIRAGISRLVAEGASGCVVLGEPGYYGRFGFTAQASLRLPGVPPRYFQAIAFAKPVPTGTVSYHAAFASG